MSTTGEVRPAKLSRNKKAPKGHAYRVSHSKQLSVEEGGPTWPRADAIPTRFQEGTPMCAEGRPWVVSLHVLVPLDR